MITLEKHKKSWNTPVEFSPNKVRQFACSKKYMDTHNYIKNKKLRPTRI